MARGGRDADGPVLLDVRARRDGREDADGNT